MRKLVLTTLLTVISVSALLAQDGFIRGKVIEEATAEPLFGATVLKKGTMLGTTSDFDGNFSLTLPAGVHDIVIQSVSFQTIILEGIEVKAGQPTILDIVMKEDVQQLGEVVVTAEVAKDNDSGVLLVQKKSLNTMDGISSGSFRKIGDSNLSSAMKRVTGVSVQGDRYVYVRGLGDRYTKTAVNGMVIPGLDPDRNDVQIDIFPTGILENVLVFKTFTPDLPGSFTGGLIDIQTKAFPDQKNTSISLSLGYNPDMHFKSDYLTYNGSSTDWLGFDNGKRDLPVSPDANLDMSKETNDLFNPQLGGTKGKRFLNTGFNFSHRNQIVGNKLTWGYNALMTYKSDYKFYQGFERQQYQKEVPEEGQGLEKDYGSKGGWSAHEVLWSGLVSVAAKSKNTTIGTTFLNIQNGESQVVKRTRRNTGLNNPAFLYNDILTYKERHMFNHILFGKHQFNRWRLSWTNSLILSSQDEPDYRETAINLDDGEYKFQNGGLVNRFWRDLSELNESFKVDLEFKLNDMNNIRFGGIVTYKDRSFNVYNFNYTNLTSSNVDSSDPNDLRNYFGSEERPGGLFIVNGVNDRNSYDATQTITGAYLMNEMKIGQKLKSVYGARLETVKMTYTGIVSKDGIGENVNDETTLDETNILPSVSLIYSVNDNMNIRGSFNKTLARPSFKEKSEAIIIDPITSIWFLGNINVKQAEILNYDLRWENFFGANEMISASLFYKDFTNHIALVAYDIAPNNVTPRNVGSAASYGLELEGRKNLSFLGPQFTNLSAGANLTYTISRVDRRTVIVNEEGQNEYQSEVDYLRGKTEGVDKYRNMSNQAPYSVNVFLRYETSNQDLTANISYNVQGSTLTYVAASYVPSVYTQPFHSVNFQVSKSFGETLNSTLSFKVDNILDDVRELTYEYESQSELFSLQNIGRTFTLSYRYSF